MRRYGTDTVDIRQLRTLIAIADHGTFGSAADAVGLTQSAVSQHIRAIEDDLQLRLFDRTQRPPRLTLQGQTLVEAARKLVCQYEQIVNSLAGGKLTGTLELGTMRTSLTGALPQALVILRDRFPDLRIHVITGDTADLPGMVATGRINAAILPEQSEFGDALRWMPFSIEPLRVIAPQWIEDTSERDILEHHPYIRFSRNVPCARLINQEIRRRNIAVSEVMAIDSFAGIVALVERGLGVSVVPQQTPEHAFPEGVRHVAFGDPPVTRIVGIIDKAGGTKSQLVDTLHEELWRLSGAPDFSG